MRWRSAGAELAFFSPLADEVPAADADAVYLPGGYPELHAGRLAGNGQFMGGLRAAALRGAVLFGECGGYMVLGEGLIDAEGQRHAMAGLLPVETSFAERRLHLGYRSAELAVDCGLGSHGAAFRGHEFHYAVLCREGAGDPLFRCRDAAGRDLGAQGRRHGSVLGSFLHLIDRAADRSVMPASSVAREVAI
jgi:cobyrinic acid a,c-diamide synthase